MSDELHLPAGVDAALARLQGSVDTGFATTNGRLELMLHRADQQDQRVDRLDKRVQVLEVATATEEALAAVTQRVRDLEATRATEERVDTVVLQVRNLEASRATKEEVKTVATRAEGAVMKEDMAARQKHILGWTTVIVGVIGILVGAVVTVSVAFLT
ncbi:hypothetical protein ACFXKD_27865 [Nocardiopsis aegyptia]|uniref:hypothetical protein n=1 Tax=Nocardiopsis aegyptia TaxID=220378 RepID=UPI00366F0267